jgi:hypothetical protein
MLSARLPPSPFCFSQQQYKVRARPVKTRALCDRGWPLPMSRTSHLVASTPVLPTASHSDEHAELLRSLEVQPTTAQLQQCSTRCY